MVRLFTCIWPPEVIIEDLEDFKKKISKINIVGKFTEKENLHVTITFLGEINEDKLREVKKKLRECLKNTSEFHVKLEGLKLIPNENYVKIIGINVKSEKLKRLVKGVGKEVGGKFHEKSKITLCRVKAVPNKESLNDFIKKYRNVKLGSFHVKKISLVKSTLTGKGPIYETLYEVELKKK